MTVWQFSEATSISVNWTGAILENPLKLNNILQSDTVSTYSCLIRIFFPESNEDSWLHHNAKLRALQEFPPVSRGTQRNVVTGEFPHCDKCNFAAIQNSSCKLPQFLTAVSSVPTMDAHGCFKTALPNQ